MVKVFVCCLAAVVLAAGCSGDNANEAEPASTSTSQGEIADGPPVVELGGDLLAEVAGVGQIHQGFAVFGDGEPAVTATKAGLLPEVDGVLGAGPGLTGEVGAPFTGALQVRLEVPAPPTNDAIPVVIHRDAAGDMTLEPALWDPGTSEMVVWATTFSDRWGAWFDPRNWAEEVAQIGQGTFDFVADFVSGRTDPPACGNNPPAWGAITPHEASSVHVCGQANPAEDGAERIELFLKSNRRTAQIISVPSLPTDYLWTENVPDSLRPTLTAVAGGVDPENGTVLLGTYAMSLGYRQPDQDVSFDVVSYQSNRLVVLNPALALLGNLPLEGTLGAAAAVAKCHAEASGIDVTRLDALPDDARLDAETLEGILRCAFEVLQQPELAFDTVRTIAGTVGAEDAAGLERVHAALKSFAPTVTRIASGLAIGSVLTNLWDGVFDNVADGRISLALTAPITEFDRDDAATRWVALDQQCRGQTTGIDQRACDERDALTVQIWVEAQTAFFKAWQTSDLATGEQLSTEAVRSDPAFGTAVLFERRPQEGSLDCADDYAAEGFICYETVQTSDGNQFDVYLEFDILGGYVLLARWAPDV